MTSHSSCSRGLKKAKFDSLNLATNKCLPSTHSLLVLTITTPVCSTNSRQTWTHQPSRHQLDWHSRDDHEVKTLSCPMMIINTLDWPRVWSASVWSRIVKQTFLFPVFCSGHALHFSRSNGDLCCRIVVVPVIHLYKQLLTEWKKEMADESSNKWTKTGQMFSRKRPWMILCSTTWLHGYMARIDGWLLLYLISKSWHLPAGIFVPKNNNPITTVLFNSWMSYTFHSS